jgi:hypothetical protein
LQSVFVLNEFRERLSSQRLYQRLRSFMAEQKSLELRDFYKEVTIAPRLLHFWAAPNIGAAASTNSVTGTSSSWQHYSPSCNLRAS